MDNFKNIALITCISSLPVVGYLLYLNTNESTESKKEGLNIEHNIELNQQIDEKKENSKKTRPKQKSKKNTYSKKSQTRKKQVSF